MSRIVLIRHGATEGNERRLYYGSTDIPLSPAGRAALLALRTAGGYPDPEGFSFCTSGMLRTEETLELLYGRVEHRAEPAFREVDFGAFEMRGYEELKTDSAFRAWCEGDNASNVPPGGESYRAMAERVWSAFAPLTRDGRDHLVVCHGGPIYAIMSRLFPGENRILYEWVPGNGRGYEITLDGSERAWINIPKGDGKNGQG